MSLTSQHGLLLLPHVQIQNANAISSPLTHGFPAISAFLGTMWALNRRLQTEGLPIALEKVGVITHWHQEQVNQSYVKTFNLSRNPLDKAGKTAAIVEEGRIHLDVSLIFQVRTQGSALAEHGLGGLDQAALQSLAQQIDDQLRMMRIAGGSVIQHSGRRVAAIPPQLHSWPEDTKEQYGLTKSLRRQCLPGFALVSRQKLLQQRWQKLLEQSPQASLLDAWLDLSRFNYSSHQDEGGKVTWKHDRKGWLVPIPVGYTALDELQESGTVRNARDDSTPFRFVESVYSIGEWVSPHRLESIQDLLWHASYDEKLGTYLCSNDYSSEPEQELEEWVELEEFTFD